MKILPHFPRSRASLTAAALGLALCPRVHAHIQAGQASGFASGFSHPWGGLDHVAAMVAVGLWGAQLGLPALWLLPVAFPLVMAVGGFMGLMGLPLPGVELAVATSALLLGLIVAAEVKPRNLIWPALLVGGFGLFHGHVHGTELPPGQNGLLYSIGFVSATGTLHGCGIALGLIHRWGAGQKTLRAIGAIIALGGAYFLWEAARPGATATSAVPEKVDATKPGR